MTGDKKWIGVGEAAERLGVDPQTIRRYADANKLESIRLAGGHRRISAADIERMYTEIYGEKPQQQLS